MRIFCILFVLIFIYGCCQKHPYYKDDTEKIGDEIMYQVAMQLKREKNLIPCGTGGGNGEKNKVRMLYLAFNYYEEIDIEEARALLIHAGKLFLKRINEDERIQPHLLNFPFQSKNIEMTIFFFKPNRKKVTPKKLTLITLRDGKIRYEIDDPKTNFLETILTETYEEAQEKVKEQSVCRGLKC